MSNLSDRIINELRQSGSSWRTAGGIAESVGAPIEEVESILGSSEFEKSSLAVGGSATLYRLGGLKAWISENVRSANRYLFPFLLIAGLAPALAELIRAWNFLDSNLWWILRYGPSLAVSLLTIGLAVWSFQKPRQVPGALESLVLSKFHRSWMTLWVVWALVACLQTLMTFTVQGLPGNAGWVIWLIGSNLGSILVIHLLLQCFLIIRLPRRSYNAMLSAVSLTLIVILAIEAAWIFSNHSLYSISAGDVDLVRIFDLTITTMLSLSLCLIAGTLSSRLFGLPLWLIGSIYLYALCQLGLMVMSDSRITGAQEALLILTLSFKLLFFAAVRYLLDTGRLAYALRASGEVPV